VRSHPDHESVPAPSSEASVVLDIGGDRGALVVYAPETLAGLEIEIRRPDEPWDGTHTAVRRRDLSGGTCFAGVFGSLRAGAYQARLRDVAGGPVVGLSVTGGQVAQVQWPSGP
jgi:hypothetical protein